MKYYVFQFEGHYPVGAWGVVIAANKKEAYKIASELIKTENLDPDSIYYLEEITTSKIIANGDY